MGGHTVIRTGEREKPLTKSNTGNMAAAYETVPGACTCFALKDLEIWFAWSRRLSWVLLLPSPVLAKLSVMSADSDESNSVSEKRPARPKRQASRATAADPSDSSTDEEPEAKSDDEGSSNTWDCSLCTFKNSAEAFRCSMCDSRKGTSTRKPRINAQMVAQQVARQQQQILLKARDKEGREKGDRKRSLRETSPSSSIGAASSCSETKRRNSDADLSPSPGPSKSKKESQTKKDSKIISKSPSSKEKTAGATKSSKSSKNTDHNFKNVDRNSSMSRAVTVNNVTVIITEFRAKKCAPKKKKKKKPEESNDGGKESNSTCNKKVQPKHQLPAQVKTDSTNGNSSTCNNNSDDTPSKGNSTHNGNEIGSSHKV